MLLCQHEPDPPNGCPNVKRPEIRCASSGNLRIAYQIVGQGPVDLVFVPGFLSNLDVHWEDPGYAHLFRRLSTFARVIQFDKRGTGPSDRIVPNDSPDPVERMDDLRAVMDAAGSERAAILAASEGAPIAMQFATTYPMRTKALILYAAYANFHKSVLRPDAAERFADEAERSWGNGSTLRAFAPGKVNDPQFGAWWARLERQTCSPSTATRLARLDAQVNVSIKAGMIWRRTWETRRQAETALAIVLEPMAHKGALQ